MDLSGPIYLFYFTFKEILRMKLFMMCVELKYLIVSVFLHVCNIRNCFVIRAVPKILNDILIRNA